MEHFTKQWCKAENVPVCMYKVVKAKVRSCSDLTDSSMYNLYIKKATRIIIPDNYRGISLFNICSKLYSYIINKRLTQWIEENSIISESLAAFRKRYCTVDHLFTLVALIQKQLRKHRKLYRKLYVAFVDFRKAFDSVVRTKLRNILRHGGVKRKMYRFVCTKL